jgi:hypothetical protein
MDSFLLLSVFSLVKSYKGILNVEGSGFLKLPALILVQAGKLQKIDAL